MSKRHPLEIAVDICNLGGARDLTSNPPKQASARLTVLPLPVLQGPCAEGARRWIRP